MIQIPHSNQIRAGRALLGWSVQDLAERAGVTVATVKKAESSPGEADEVRAAKLAAICGALNASGVVFTKDLSRLGVALDLRGR
ncbi:helix-turn-helix domain-containing protein [Cucumibacter marinus]|uniref:helix-turn-helix domain-containing protein n=1 Tax=Cucumibacter marinus TaxID=1121252 RepID=UPI00040504C4|nr:helix-turn-helix domain-containing protein [Cucumibacter marinus]